MGRTLSPDELEAEDTTPAPAAKAKAPRVVSADDLERDDAPVHFDKVDRVVGTPGQVAFSEPVPATNTEGRAKQQPQPDTKPALSWEEFLRHPVDTSKRVGNEIEAKGLQGFYFGAAPQLIGAMDAVRGIGDKDSFGDRYRKSRDAQIAVQDAADKDMPNTAMAAQTVGGIGSDIALLGTGMGAKVLGPVVQGAKGIVNGVMSNRADLTPKNVTGAGAFDAARDGVFNGALSAVAAEMAPVTSKPFTGFAADAMRAGPQKAAQAIATEANSAIMPKYNGKAAAVLDRQAVKPALYEDKLKNALYTKFQAGQSLEEPTLESVKAELQAVADDKYNKAWANVHPRVRNVEQLAGEHADQVWSDAAKENASSAKQKYITDGIDLLEKPLPSKVTISDEEAQQVLDARRAKAAKLPTPKPVDPEALKKAVLAEIENRKRAGLNVPAPPSSTDPEAINALAKQMLERDKARGIVKDPLAGGKEALAKARKQLLKDGAVSAATGLAGTAVGSVGGPFVAGAGGVAGLLLGGGKSAIGKYRAAVNTPAVRYFKAGQTPLADAIEGLGNHSGSYAANTVNAINPTWKGAARDSETLLKDAVDGAPDKYERLKAALGIK